MNDKEEEIDIIELITLIWAQRKFVIKWGFIAACIGVVVAFSIPKVYTSKAVVVPEIKSTGSGSSGSLGSLASLAGVNLGGSSVGITEALYPNIVSSTPFVFEFANMEVDLKGTKVPLWSYFTEEYSHPWWNYIISFPMKAISWGLGLFKEDLPKGDSNIINLKSLTKEQSDYKIAFSEYVKFYFDDKTGIATLEVNTQSPELSLMLADSILFQLQSYMTLYKTSKLRSELESNIIMLEQAKRNYYRADSVYAAVADRQKTVISNVALISLDRLQNEKQLTYSVYNQLAAQVELSKVKLNEETPILTVIEPTTLARRASYPKKPIMVIAFGFLGGIAAVGLILGRFFLQNRHKEDNL